MNGYTVGVAGGLGNDTYETGPRELTPFQGERQKAQITDSRVFLNSFNLALATWIRETSVGAKLRFSSRLISRNVSKSFLMLFSSQAN